MRTTITHIIDLLKVDDFYNESEIIDIAKGKYEFPSNIKGIKNYIKRNQK